MYGRRAQGCPARDDGRVQLEKTALPACTADLEAHVRYDPATTSLVLCSSLNWIALESTDPNAEAEGEFDEEEEAQ